MSHAENEKKSVLGQLQKPAPMQTYDVTITETLEYTVQVKAASLHEAEDIVEREYRDEKHVLGPEDFVDAEFKAREAEPQRGIKPPSVSHDR